MPQMMSQTRPRHAQDDAPDMPQMMPQMMSQNASNDAPDMPQMKPQTCPRWCPSHAPYNAQTYPRGWSRWPRHALDHALDDVLKWCPNGLLDILFNILEAPVFQKYSTWWVISALYLAVPGCTRLYLAEPGCTWLCLGLPSSTLP